MYFDRLLKYINTIIAVALILALVAVYWFAYRPLPATSGTIEAFVDSAVTITRDGLGTPHIAAGSIEGTGTADGDSAYGDFNATVGTATKEAYEGPMRHLGGGPETVAKAIEKAITVRRPKTRYVVTPSARLALFNRKLLLYPLTLHVGCSRREL